VQREQIRALGSDLKRVWEAATTTDRDRKDLLRSLLEEAKINVLTQHNKAHVVLCWKTSAAFIGIRTVLLRPLDCDGSMTGLLEASKSLRALPGESG
jgi:hypothetical protein